MNKDFVKNIPLVWLLITGLLVGAFSYTVGAIQASDSVSPQITVVYPPESTVRKVIVEPESAGETSGGDIIASKNGTKYYTPGCSGSSRINPENIVRYSTEQDAQEAGLELSKTCLDE